jgi:hypothetical protein
MPVELSTRPYRDGDENAILDLFARSFPHAPRALEHFRWKYLHDPFGNRRISLTFDGDGRLVGHYAGYPVPFVDDGTTLVAQQIGDTMTEPSVRHIGRGPTSILGRTALHFYEHFCERQVAFNFGFNVANIQKFSLRFLRSERVEPVSYRVRDLRVRPLQPLPRWQRWAGGHQLELVRRTTPEWDEFFARVSRAYGFLLARNAAYVRWRYLECPDVPYVVVAIRRWRRLAGWIAFRIRGRKLTWGDALFDPALIDSLDVLLRHVVPRYDVDLIEGWFPPRPRWFDAALRELHFESHPEPQDLSVMTVPFTLPDAAARIRNRLYYTWGDGDLF